MPSKAVFFLYSSLRNGATGVVSRRLPDMQHKPRPKLIKQYTAAPTCCSGCTMQLWKRDELAQTYVFAELLQRL